jgi:hypothetical protein
MNHKVRFNVFRLKGRLSRIRDWMKDHHFPPGLLFFLMGILSTLWFLIRVIPKPSRATYPCMKVAAPFMSGFVVYLLSLGGITVALRKAKQNIYKARYFTAVSFIVIAFVLMVISITNGIHNVYASASAVSGPEDGPNQPVGKARGVFPGRVVWVWDPKATNEKCISSFKTKDWFFKPQNTDEKIVRKMFRDGLNKLTGKTSVNDSWDVLFRYHNNKKVQKNKGYTKGEKIFIKINQGTSRWLLTQEDKDKGYYIPETLREPDELRESSFGPTETGPYIVLEILRELITELGVNQADISVGDPMTDIYGHNYDVWAKEFPEVKYIDKFSNMYGRTLIKPTEKELLFYSDKKQSDKLYDVIENADYLINAANFKPHAIAGITLTAKNHFGSQARSTAGHLHYSLILPRRGVPTNGGYHKYRVLVDLMGNKYLGENTLLYIVDGLFGGGGSEIKPPVKYYMAPFNNDWCNSIFMSLDQVALESVCFDFLRTEWNGVNKHDAKNSVPENAPDYRGVDDYLHQAADSSNWPAGITYDPDNSGKALPSLGIHEHWNDALNKQYSRNLGKTTGIELVSIPDTLVKSKIYSVNKVINITLGNEITAKCFYTSIVDGKNIKWFLTEKGLVSFDGNRWTNYNHPATSNFKSFALDFATSGSEVWLASANGAELLTLPPDPKTNIMTFNTGNSPLKSDTVRSIAVGKSQLKWFGTERGISAFYKNKWLTDSYQDIFPDGLFKDTPVTIMSTSPDGDTLYVGTEGAGVARVFRNDVDAISGASEYAKWGPILIPSDNIYSMLIISDGVKWFGTDSGAARHIGKNTLEHWTGFTTRNGLVNNFVQAIALDKSGKIWFGTKGGVSIFDGSSWTSFTTRDGLSSDNVLCITVDRDGIIWMGTDNGVTSFDNEKFTCYKKTDSKF